MSLSPGDRLGPYEIVSAIGKGGMGEVCSARDSRLGREVAIKVSAQQFTDRFEREARAIAALNHPNICTLFDVGPNYLVMELIEGPTLAERIAEGPIPLEEALLIAKQITDALEAAHEKGIVHRDLKPANVKVRPDGSVKVLDFGLATTGGQAEMTADSPTMVSIPGMILGTAAYMSPEQAAGQTVDKRADIWAFGVVLHEMLTGRRLFQGDTVAHLLADVLRGPIDLEQLPKETPRRVRDLIKRCLDRDVRNRLRDIGEARVTLGNRGDQDSGENEKTADAARGATPEFVWALAAILATVSVALGVLWFAHWREPKPAMVKLGFAPPENSLFNEDSPPALSPDGRRIAFVTRVNGPRMLWVRDLDSTGAHLLAGTEGAIGPFWAPDSRHLAFAAQRKLMKVDVTGGPATTITATNIENAFRGGSWGPDNVILLSNEGDGLQRVSAAGGIPAEVIPLDQGRREMAHWRPHFLPDGRHFLYSARSSDPGKTAIFAGDLRSREKKLVVQTRSSAEYVERGPGSPESAGSGYILYLQQRTLMAQPFDPSKLETTGDAVPIAENVDSTPSPYFASANGILAYSSSSSEALQLSWYDRSGRVVGTVGKPADLEFPRVSPNGKMIAADRLDNVTNNRDIWVYDLERRAEQRLTFEGDNLLPAWSPDGKRIAFTRRTGLSRTAGKLIVRAADGTGQEEVLEEGQKGISSWTRDGAFLLTMTPNDHPKTGGDISALPLAGPDARKSKMLRQTEFNETWPQASPDGRWLAYNSNETGSDEVYVMGFPPLSGHWQISIGGGRLPVWSRDGHELYFAAPGGQMMAVGINPGPQFQAGVPKPLFRVSLPSANSSYDVSADGRFLIATAAGGLAVAPMTVILNWQAGLKK
jgi:serine/threonine protein kinase